MGQRSVYFGLLALGGLAFGGIVILGATRLTPPIGPDDLSWLIVVLAPILATATFVFAKRPDHPVAHRLVVLACALSLQAAANATLVIGYETGNPRWAWALLLVNQLTIATAILAVVDLLVIFPTGRYDRPTHRIVARSLAGMFLMLPVLSLLGTRTLNFSEVHGLQNLEPANPVFVAALAPLGAASNIMWAASPVFLVIGVGLLVRRYFTRPELRPQIKWVIFGVSLDLFLLGIGALLSAFPAADIAVLSRAISFLSVLAIPLSVAVAIVRHQVLDIDVVIRRSVVYAATSAAIAVAYLGLAAALGIAAADRLPVGFAIALTVVVMLAFHPTRRALDRVAARLLLGEQVTPETLLARFGEAIERAFDLSELAPLMAKEVRRGLRLEWARIWLNIGDGRRLVLEPLGADGIAPSAEGRAEVVVPLTHAGELVGIMECGPRTHGELDEHDEEIVMTLSRQAGLALRNGRLASELAARLDEIRRQADELAASRSRIVSAQDAERRRIERNIHDGVQQEVVALIANLRLARSSLKRDPSLVDHVLSDLQEQARRTLEDLRQLAHGIHPPVLSDRGLVSAIEARAARLPIGVAIDAPEQVRNMRFSEEVETAAYFLVSEALTNVMKHGDVERASVALALSEHGELCVSVSDEGRGFVPADKQGSGLTGLKDRIEALGGRLRVVSSPGGGTELTAELPNISAVATN